MTSKERIVNILKRKPVDRIGLYEHFWGDTHKAYAEQGHDMNTLYSAWDMAECWAVSTVADLDFKPKVLKETDDTVTVLDGNGAILKKHKKHDATPEHIDFTVKSRKDWDKYKPFLIGADERRINFEAYREAKKRAAETGKFFVWSGINVFECMHPVCGHEHMLIGMALDPDWITDMAETYADLTVRLQEILFKREGKPDGIWYYEDMGFKERPFMSPGMYREMIMPQHIKTIKFAHSMSLPVIMHSCGFIEPLLPHMVEAGIDCLQTIEVKAGMDLLRIHKNFGGKISLMGGIDVRALYSNDRKIIDRELESKIPAVKEGYGYILHSDHSIPKTVDYDSYMYFIEKGLKLGTY